MKDIQQIMFLQNSTCSTNADKDGSIYFASYKRVPCVKGGYYNCYKGKLLSNKLQNRTGTNIIAKAPKDAQFTKADCEDVIKASKLTERLLSKFLKEVVGGRIDGRIIVPLRCVNDEVYHPLFPRELRKLNTNEWILLDERLNGDFENFVDSMGKSLGKNEELEAFVHYTYFKSGGKFVICNLQGVSKDRTLTLTGPIIHSDIRNFGKRDGGKSSMKKVMSRHKCNHLCDKFTNYLSGPFLASAPRIEENNTPPCEDITVFQHVHYPTRFELNGCRHATSQDVPSATYPEEDPPLYDDVISEMMLNCYYRMLSQLDYNKESV